MSFSKRRAVLLVALAVLMGACAGPTEAAPEPEESAAVPVAKEENPLAEREKYIKEDLPEGELLGPDKNKNLIRDDVEAFIDKEYGDQPKVWLAQRQLARAYQRLLAHQDNKERSVQVGDELMVALACADAMDPQAREHRNALKNVALDTERRIEAYLRSQSQMGGNTFRLPPTNADQCDFLTEGL